MAFLFTGQGAQRRGDGPGAERGVPGVRGGVDDVCGCLDEHSGALLEAVLRRGCSGGGRSRRGRLLATKEAVAE